ncbi:MAG: hypothetical protein M0Q95_18560 [Porticoccaceae bacterium]|nr:hypothetical protein [Porticoccaceae bacterium]
MLSPKPVETSCFYTRLLPDLFDQKMLESGIPVRVFDFGVARGDTIKFLSQFNCRLHVVDIIDELKRINGLANEEDSDISDADIVTMFTSAFELAGQEKFDVCLFWDSFNYLDLRVLPLFMRALLPNLSAGCLAHGFAVLNKNTPLFEQSYGIINSELLSVSDQRSTPLAYRHSQATIRDLVQGLAIKQSILRDDGRLEMLLKRA